MKLKKRLKGLMDQLFKPGSFWSTKQDLERTVMVLSNNEFMKKEASAVQLGTKRS